MRLTNLKNLFALSLLLVVFSCNTVDDEIPEPVIENLDQASIGVSHSYSFEIHSSSSSLQDDGELCPGETFFVYPSYPAGCGIDPQNIISYEWTFPSTVQLVSGYSRYQRKPKFTTTGSAGGSFYLELKIKFTTGSGCSCTQTQIETIGGQIQNCSGSGPSV